MVAPVLPFIPIITAVGRFAAPYLVKELGKMGANKFAKTYGNEAFTSLNETLANNTPMVNAEAMPMVNPNFMSKEDEEDRTPTVVDKDETKQPQKQPPPEGPDLGTELVAEAAVQTTKKLLEDKKPGISKQTKELVPEKPEFGKLTKAEIQTAKALKGDSPDFYSRTVDAIKNAKQNKFTKGKWKSIVQSNSTKEEMKYLGLDKYLQGNESITKEELLKFVEKKDIAPNITVRSIPKDEMNKMYETYSLGGYTAENTQEHIVFQIDIPERRHVYGNEILSAEKYFLSEHFNREYGSDTFAHARTQVGFDPLDAMTRYQDLNSEEIEKAFKNTLIIDEIQSDWLQKGQDKGFVSDFDIVPENKLIEYLEKNNIFYKLSKAPTEFTDRESGVDVIEFQQSGPIKPGDAPILDTLNVGYDKNFIFNKSDKTHYLTTGENIDPVEYLMREEGKVPDFPIKESKKFVELVLNKMIEKAVLDGRDSIAITNGQIQANRYDAMGKEEKQGLKKFYDEIVFKQLEKISDKYNVKLERIDISEGEAPKELQDIHFGNQIKRAQEDGFVLKKVDLQFLWDRIKDTDIPGHAALYSDRGVGQGANYIEDYLYELVDNRPFSPATGTGSGLDTWNEIRTNSEFGVYIWIKERDVSRNLIGWELPIVPIKDAVNYAKDSLLPEIQGEDLGAYQKYVQDTKPPKGEEINPEQLIKMKLPKKLQKESLSKPIKLSKTKKQTDRLFA